MYMYQLDLLGRLPPRARRSHSDCLVMPARRHVGPHHGRSSDSESEADLTDLADLRSWAASCRQQRPDRQRDTAMPLYGSHGLWAPRARRYPLACRPHRTQLGLYPLAALEHQPVVANCCRDTEVYPSAQIAVSNAFRLWSCAPFLRPSPPSRPEMGHRTSYAQLQTYSLPSRVS